MLPEHRLVDEASLGASLSWMDLAYVVAYCPVFEVRKAVTVGVLAQSRMVAVVWVIVNGSCLPTTVEQAAVAAAGRCW